VPAASNAIDHLRSFPRAVRTELRKHCGAVPIRTPGGNARPSNPRPCFNEIGLSGVRKLAVRGVVLTGPGFDKIASVVWGHGS
jgi:hypothetical protein